VKRLIILRKTVTRIQRGCIAGGFTLEETADLPAQQFFDAVLTKLPAPSDTLSGTKALVSQKASIFFTLFLNRRSQLIGDNLGCWQSEK
jgi:hypothetical protein